VRDEETVTFSKQLSSAVTQNSKTLNQAWKKSVVGAFTQYVITTPVDTGAARGSYVVSQTVSQESPNSTTPTRVVSQQIPDIGGAVSIYSTLPYMERLDDGYSKQAPAGMTTIVTRNWSTIVKRNGGG